MGNVEVKDSGSLQAKSAIARFLELENTFKGVILFGRAKDKKSFIFDEGNPCFPNANISEATLGRILFEKNLMTTEQFTKIKEIEATGKTFFESLIVISPKEKIYEVIFDQWLEDMSTVFSWDSGQFASVEMLPKDVSKIEKIKPIQHYLFQALIRKNKKVKSKFPATMRFETEAQEGLKFTIDQLGLSDVEKKIHAAFKQLKPIKTVATETGSTEPIVASIILSFRELGLARADSDSKKKIVVAQPQVYVSTRDEFTKQDEENLLAKLQKIDELDYYDILGVKRDVAQAQLQSIYFTLAKKYHPDRLKTKISVAVKDAEKFFAKITEAYNTLSNVQLRKEYEFKTSGEASQHEALMKKILDSESLFLDGKGFIQKNMFPEAIQKLQEAIAMYDKEPEYFMNLGWALFRQGVKDNAVARIAEGKKLLVDAYNREYLLSEVSYYLGMVSKHENKIADAIKYLRRCVAEDSNHSLAMSELRFLEKKQDQKPGKKK